jgi:Mg-chelatase subunit ChlD
MNMRTRRRWEWLALGATIGCSQPTTPVVKTVPDETVDAMPPTKTIATSRLAIALVLDRSGSMAGMKLEEVKLAAKEVSDALDADDRLEVIAFDTVPQRVVTLRPGDEHMVSDDAIHAIQAGGGTDMLPAIVAAFDDLSKISAKKKHVVMITDGLTPTAGLIESVEIAAAEGITLTTIALGSDTDALTLQSMASSGGGRFYAVRDPEVIPRVFTKELEIVRDDP